jgi:hypothetical protein
MKSLEALIEREENGGSLQSSLRLFCRMDIAVMNDSKSEFHYFIKGVSRTLNSVLFMTGRTPRLSENTTSICQAFMRTLSELIT